MSEDKLKSNDQSSSPDDSGKTPKKSKWKTILIVIVVLLIIGALSNGNSGNSANSSSSSNSSPAASSAKAESSSNDQQESEKTETAKVKVDKSNLVAGINQWQGLAVDDYTPETWQKFSTALDNAKKLNEDENATQNQVDDANRELVQAHGALKEAFKPENYQQVAYIDVARNPDNYKNQKIVFSGKVLQVLEGTTETDLRIATDGGYGDVVFVGFDPSILNGTHVLEDDSVTVYGTCIGQYSYTSALGSKISLPGLYADNVVIN